MFNLGFETIGNATVIAHDNVPVIATDPWLSDSAYFGSWILSHKIPDEQLDSISKCRYIWFSHGHPDHLNSHNISQFKDKIVLLPDHFKGRIQSDLVAQGLRVQVMKDCKWYPLSERIQALCVSDFNQDAVLLLNIGGKLVVNLNDAGNNGTFSFVRSVIKKFDTSYLMALTGYGDANMINFFDEAGNRIPPPAAAKKPVGSDIAGLLKSFGATYFVPFSSHHQYQRTDSVWANEYLTRLEDYSLGFDVESAGGGKLLPAYIRVDCLTESYEEIAPPARVGEVVDSKIFGDNWSDVLSSEDLILLEKYFKSADFLPKYLDYINLRVGGRDNVISFKKSGFTRGVTFETPRFSLVEAAKWEVFDDLLIGNYMKTTLHGEWPESKLFPCFDGHLTKYADNGRAKTEDEVRAYFREYTSRAPLRMISFFAAEKGKGVFRQFVSKDSKAYQVTRQAYRSLRGMG